MLLLAGTGPGCVDSGGMPPLAPLPPELGAVAVPLGPDDPLAVELLPDRIPVEPAVRDAAGKWVALEPRTVGGDEGWAPPGGWESGAYEVAGAADQGVLLPEAPIRFEVGAYGQDPVDPAALVGRTWVAAGYASSWTPLIGAIGEQRTAGLVIEAVDGERVTFWVLGQVDGEWCGILHDEGTLSEDGSRLVWARDALEVETAGTVVTGHDLALSVAWLDDTRRAWGTASGGVDTRALVPVFDLGDSPTAVCEISATLGWTCGPCPDGEPVCLPMGAHAIDLREAEPLDPAELPRCGIDPLEVDAPEVQVPSLACDIEPIELEFDVDCGCRTVGLQGGVPLLIVGLVASRRRRRAGHA